MSVNFSLYSSIFTGYNFNLKYINENSMVLSFGTGFTCSLVNGAPTIVVGTLYTYSCASQSLVYGDLRIRITSQEEDQYSACTYQTIAADGSTVTNTVTAPKVYRVTVISRFRPLDNLRIKYPLPQIFHLRHRLMYYSSDPAFDMTQELTSVGITPIEQNVTIYNCAANCETCTDSDYPVGQCNFCSGLYEMTNGVSCTCKLASSRTENFSTTALAFDDGIYVATDPLYAQATADSLTATALFAGTNTFMYNCTSLSVFAARSSCFNSSLDFFSPSSLQVKVSPSATTLNFDMSVTNTAGKSISAVCAQNLFLSTFLLYDVSASALTPKKLVKSISSRTATASSSSLFLGIDLSSIRTDNQAICGLVTYPSFSVQTCGALVNVYHKFTEAPATNAELFKREFFSYSYYVGTFMVKSIFVESFTSDCLNCNLMTSPELMMKICNTSDCSPGLVNSSVLIKTTVYVIVAFSDPVILFNSSVQDIRIFASGSEVTNSTITEITGGTTPAKMVVSC